MTPFEKQDIIKELHNTEARKIVKLSYSTDSDFFQRRAFMRKIDAYMKRRKRYEIDLLIIDQKVVTE